MQHRRVQNLGERSTTFAKAKFGYNVKKRCNAAMRFTDSSHPMNTRASSNERFPVKISRSFLKRNSWSSSLLHASAMYHIVFANFAFGALRGGPSAS